MPSTKNTIAGTGGALRGALATAALTVAAFALTAQPSAASSGPRAGALPIGQDVGGGNGGLVNLSVLPHAYNEDNDRHTEIGSSHGEVDSEED
ncbi:hypothetical protein DPM19_22100 [Actinomadura craniellae]|uniref:DUF320 domain-containing protein n=1 Tax=Actinomadura craniellae TaxID=2231787 RepID=A0A365H255_9ACTN|nr:hypothetical protein [Actinomadura craniellae]RAY13185.1 hypothetical protein DPM19_22100 [Actinomadura craniellae]